MSDDVLIASLLEAEGFAGAAGQRAREVLEAARLTRPGKARIAAAKVTRVRGVLRASLARVCGDPTCLTVVQGREIVQVATSDCEACSGSSNRRAGQLATRALRDHGLRRVLVLGGTPIGHETLRRVLGDRAEVRCIDGMAGPRPRASVRADLDWADVLVIWASTPLPHKVSLQYTEHLPERLRVVRVARRSVEALCHALARSLS